MQVNSVLGKVAYENPAVSGVLVKFILENLNRVSHEESYILAYLHLAQMLLSLKDSLS